MAKKKVRCQLKFAARPGPPHSYSGFPERHVEFLAVGGHFNPARDVPRATRLRLRTTQREGNTRDDSPEFPAEFLPPFAHAGIVAGAKRGPEGESAL